MILGLILGCGGPAVDVPALARTADTAEHAAFAEVPGVLLAELPGVGGLLADPCREDVASIATSSDTTRGALVVRAAESCATRPVAGPLAPLTTGRDGDLVAFVLDRVDAALAADGSADAEALRPRFAGLRGRAFAGLAGPGDDATANLDVDRGVWKAAIDACRAQPSTGETKGRDWAAALGGTPGTHRDHAELSVVVGPSGVLGIGWTANPLSPDATTCVESAIRATAVRTTDGDIGVARLTADPHPVRAGQVEVAAVTLDGPLPPADAKAAFTAWDGLARCWSDALGRDRPAANVAIGFTVTPEGRATQVSVASGTDDVALASCLALEVGAIKFPPGPSSSSGTVTLALTP
jgi:hypothetical protein